MSEMDECRTVLATAKDVLEAATEEGHHLIVDAGFRRLEDGQLVSDVYDADGQVVATYEVKVVVGSRVGP